MFSLECKINKCKFFSVSVKPVFYLLLFNINMFQQSMKIYFWNLCSSKIIFVYPNIYKYSFVVVLTSERLF